MLSGDVLDGEEAYEFTWVGKKAAVVGANRPSRKTLRPCKENSVNWDTTENLYIEGDNLEVLKLLQESYLNAVDVIYIDPPYNTGSNLIYKNNFFQTEDDYSKDAGVFDDEGNRLFVNSENNGRFHSDWCSMIYARLILARNLLKKTGVLVCAIDQSEVNTLGLMLSELFSDKEVTLVSIIHNPSGTQGENFSHNNEYVYFVYDGNILRIDKYREYARNYSFQPFWYIKYASVRFFYKGEFYRLTTSALDINNELFDEISNYIERDLKSMGAEFTDYTGMMD